MNDQESPGYPDIIQSWGILGIIFLLMILSIPFGILLEKVLDE